MLKEEKRSSKHISPATLQNPTDPDAIYRKKGKKKHIGYTASLIKKLDYDNLMINGYDLQKNTYGGQKFAQNAIKKLEDTTILTDGAYFSEDINNKASAKGIKMGSLLTWFEIDEKEHLVNKCPSGHKFKHSTFKEGLYRAICSQLITKLGNSEYQELARKRAGIEGGLSTLRRRYKIDHLLVRGKVRSKVWLVFKISAIINCKRLIKDLTNRPKEDLPLAYYLTIYFRYSVFKGHIKLNLLINLDILV